MLATVPLAFLNSDATWTMTFSAFFDESGKFRDQSVISFCGVAAGDFRPFMDEWQEQLSHSGLINTARSK